MKLLEINQLYSATEANNLMTWKCFEKAWDQKEEDKILPFMDTCVDKFEEERTKIWRGYGILVDLHQTHVFNDTNE